MKPWESRTRQRAMRQGDGMNGVEAARRDRFKWTLLVESESDYLALWEAAGWAGTYFPTLTGDERRDLAAQALSELVEEGFVFLFRGTWAQSRTVDLLPDDILSVVEDRAVLATPENLMHRRLKYDDELVWFYITESGLAKYRTLTPDSLSEPPA